MGTVDEKEVEGEGGRELYRNLAVINSLASAVNQSLQLEEVLSTAVERLNEVFEDVSGIEVYLLNQEGKNLFLKAPRSLSPDMIGTGILQKGEGLAGCVVEKGKPVFLESLKGDKRIDDEIVKQEKLASYAGVPLLSFGEVIGVLGIYFKVPHSFSEEKELFSELGSRIGIAVHNALLYEQASMRARRFVAISRAITVTRQLGTLNEVLQDITKVLVQSLGFDQSWIGLVDEKNKVLQGKVGFGMGMKAREIFSTYSVTASSKNPAVMAIVKQKPMVYQFVEDIEDEDLKKWLKGLKVQSFGYVPILSGENAVGVIGVFYVTDQAFEQEDVKTLISVAEQSSIAIENAQLYERIKTSEERYRTLFEAAGTSLAIFDENHQFRLVNHAFEKLSGYSKNELVGKETFVSFLINSKWTKKAVIAKLKMPPQSWEGQFVDKNGIVKQVHITTANIPDSSEIFVSLIDMTHQRELERRLFRSEGLAAIGELSAGIAHEIRNPLVAITTSVSLLKDEPQLSQEGQQLLDVVKEESDHLAAIVDDFLQFARPKKPSFHEEDINRLLSDVVNRYKNWKGKKIRLVEHYENNIPPISLDKHQIQQVITNLVMNSLDAMDEDGVLTIETQREKKMSEDVVHVMVTDSGVGIPEDEITKIFQPFYSTKEKGTGMGLAICRRIINEHGGEISVESRVGKGTTFSVILPVRRKQEKI